MVAPVPEAVMRLEHSLRSLVADSTARSVLAQVLASRGLAADDAVEFLQAPLARLLRPPELMLDLERASGRLAEAVEKGERVVVYGDYDVDGMAGTAELVLFLGSLGVEVVAHIPDRIKDGYGLNQRAIRTLASHAPGLLVTVDCGTTAQAEVSLAGELGFETIICDHHQPGQDRPSAYAVLNPHQEGCQFPFKGLCAAGIVFYLLGGVRRLLRQRGRDNLPDLRTYLDLVALASVADVVPLVEENRALVKFGLEQIRRRARPGIAALLEVSGVEFVNSEAIAFQLAPRINAAGRIGDSRLGMELLTTADKGRAREIAAALDQSNRDRRGIEASMLREAVEACEKLHGWPKRHSIVVWSAHWHPGVGGIVAARLADRYGLPAIVVSVEQGIGRGSGRTAGGVALDLALDRCRHLCERAGGHREAVGLTIAAEYLPAFTEQFERTVSALAATAAAKTELAAEAEVQAGFLTSWAVEALGLLEPCGEGNPAPVLLTRGLRVIGRRLAGERHLMLRLTPGGAKRPRLEAIGFGMGGIERELGEFVDCLYTPKMDYWRGNQRIRLQLRAVRTAG